MHLYLQDGKPFYEVPYADPSKGMRKATLADARKCGAVPSVTEIIKIMDAPALTRWKIQQGIWSALTLPRELDESDDEFLARVMHDSKEKAKTAAEKGDEIHHAIERAFQGRLVDSQYFEIAYGVKAKVLEKYGADHHWIAEKSFAHFLGFGGKVDLHTPCVPIVADFKTKEKFSTRMAYDNHVLQLSAYAYGLGLPDAKLVNIFVQWDGEVEFYEWTDAESKRAWDGFQKCFEMWKWNKKYDPSFQEAA